MNSTKNKKRQHKTITKSTLAFTFLSFFSFSSFTQIPLVSKFKIKTFNNPINNTIIIHHTFNNIISVVHSLFTIPFPSPSPNSLLFHIQYSFFKNKQTTVHSLELQKKKIKKMSINQNEKKQSHY